MGTSVGGGEGFTLGSVSAGGTEGGSVALFNILATSTYVLLIAEP